MSELPSGGSWLATRLGALERWARSRSLRALVVEPGCCAGALLRPAGGGARLVGLGLAGPRSCPEESDLLLVAGAITDRAAPVVRQIYDRMAEPRWVVAVGACAGAGGPFRSYAVVQGVGEILPVDLWIPGCPPSPDAWLAGLERLRELIRDGARPGRKRARGST